MIHSRWSGGDLIFYDSTQDIMTIKDNADGIEFGVDNDGVDVLFYGDTASAYMEWDADTDDLLLEGGAGIAMNGGDISLGDTDYIKFGDGSDFTIACSTGDVLQIIPAVDGADINFGSTAGDKSVDITIYGADASHHLKWVSASDQLDVTATIEMQSTEKIQFSGTNHYIHASTTGQLDIVTDGIIKLDGEVTNPTPAAVSSTGDNQTLTAASVRTQFLTSTGAFNLIVPTSSGTGIAGIEFKLFNSTGGACTVYETSTGTTAIVAIPAGESAIVASNATEWRYLVSST